MKTNSRIGAVIIGGDFQALGAIRSLSENNIPVFLIDHEFSISRFSRYIKRRVKNYSLLSSNQFSDYLIRIAINENLKGWVLFPNNDEIVKLISINRDKLQNWFRVPVPSWEIVKKFYYKQNAYRIAENISIPVPKMYRCENLEGLLKSNLQFPLVLKPSSKEVYYPITKKKAIRIEKEDELIIEYNKMAAIIDPEDIVVQEMIEGGPKNLYSYVTFFDGDKTVAGTSAIRLRQHPMDFGHATTYAESVKIPELEEMANKLLKEIGYFGIAEVEFMKDDKTNNFKFIEINGRIWGWHTLAKAAGLNIPYILFKYMTDQEIKATSPVEGVKWIRLITDTPTVLKELIAGRMKLKDYFRTLKGKKEYAVFSFKDPLPFLMEYIMAPYLWLKRGF